MPFEDGIRKFEQLLDGVGLNVLVWGPGSGEHLEKREKVREEIKRVYRNADVRFSEDIEMGESLSLPDQELIHLAVCHLCVVLDTSKGSGEEIAHFVGTRYAHKLMILTHEEFKGATSFPASLRENQNQEFYSDAEYQSCNLVERVLRRVRAAALREFAYGPF